MKVVILAGGRGTRIIEETEPKPKPLIEIGGKPIIWHIMKHFAHYGFKDFIITLGHRGKEIKKYLPHFLPKNEDWKVNLVDTGQETQTGGRIKRVYPLTNNQTFMLALSDGVANIDLKKLLKFHRSHGKLATITAVKPPVRFGCLKLKENKVIKFQEKKPLVEEWINGGFFVLEPQVIDFIRGNNTQLEKEPLEKLAQRGELIAYKHNSFWQCMDTLHEKMCLEELWSKGNAPWKTWR